MTPRASSSHGSLCCLFGDVTFLLVGLLHFGGDSHRHFYFGFLAGISDLDLQLSSLSKLRAAHRARPFTHLPGDASAPSALKVQVLHRLSNGVAPVTRRLQN